MSDLVIVPAGGNLPCVSPRVSDHRSAVAIGHVGRYFQGGRIRRYRSGVGRIDIRHVHVQKRSGGLAETTAVTDHDDGIADPHFGGSTGLKFTLRTEDRLQERDKLFRVPDDDPGRNGMPSVRLKFDHAARLRTIAWRDCPPSA